MFKSWLLPWQKLFSFPQNCLCYECSHWFSLYFGTSHCTPNCVANHLTSSFGYSCDDAKVVVPPFLVENPSGDVKVEVAPLVKNLPTMLNLTLPSHVVDIPSDIVYRETTWGGPNTTLEYILSKRNVNLCS